MESTEEFKHYWETDMFFQSEEFDRYQPNLFLSASSSLLDIQDSSSPDGAASSSTSKNIVSERNRRKKLNERLFTLRAVVPNISKMDKASIIKDAIDYIQELHEQERRIQAEISELETVKSKSPPGYEFEQEIPALVSKSKKKRTQHCYDSSGFSPIDVLELTVAYMKEKTIVVSLTCSKRADTMAKLCQVFEYLKLKIITASITAFSGRLLKTVFVEADEEEKDLLKVRIESAITALNDPQSPMSI